MAPTIARVQPAAGPQSRLQRVALHRRGHLRPLSRRPMTVTNFTQGPAVDAVAQQRRAKAASTPLAPGQKPPLTLSWAGAGVFFFWQLGAVSYLAERYDLTKVRMVGASGGALACVLAGCAVAADKVFSHAYALSLKYNIWERPSGVMGIWGRLIEQWLDDLLPADAVDMCNERLTVIVTEVPTLRQIGVSSFSSKADLIDVCMASSHVPLVLDGRWTRACRGANFVDGSLADFFYGNCDLLVNGGAAVLFDYFEDPNLKRNGRMDMLQLKSYAELQHMFELGYQYAAKRHMDGAFDKFDLAPVLRPHLQLSNRHHAHASSPSSSSSSAAVVLGNGQQPPQPGEPQLVVPQPGGIVRPRPQSSGLYA